MNEVKYSRLKMPEKGISETEALEAIREITRNDMIWSKGHVSLTMTIEVSGIMEKIFNEYLETNYVYGAMLYPGLTRLEREAVSMIASFMGSDTATGDIVSGGTESIYMGELASRDKVMAEKKVKEPNAVLPNTIHPCHFKGCHLMKMECRKVPADEKTWTVDPKQMDEAIDDNTVMIAGSVGEHMHGAVDPIPELAKIAEKRDVPLHVDSCWGGFIIPFLQRNPSKYPGVAKRVPPVWDFRLDSVTTLSIDPHKLLMAPMPAGCILYRDESLRKYALYENEDLSNPYISQVLQGSRTGAPIPATWALLKIYGQDFLQKNAEIMMDATLKLVELVSEIPGMEPVIEPNMNLVAFKTEVDPKRVSAEMDKRGWRGTWPATTPPSFRCIILPQMAPKVEAFVKDLKEVTSELA